MRDYRVLVVTLMSETTWGPCIASHVATIRNARNQNPALIIDHLMAYGHPQMMTDGHDIVTHKYKMAREAGIQGNYQAIVTLEDDMIVPDVALYTLLNQLWDGANIAYGLYVFRHGNLKWSAYTRLDANSGYPLNSNPEAAREAWGKVIDVAGVGLGCTAIDRATFESLPFRRGGVACNDWYLALDAQRANLKQICDTSIICGHASMEPSPRIIWPDPDAPHMARIEFLDV